ncbi:pentatricopeptide repeat-containing protein At3g29230 [Rutidosis leptorrhynchoides]|uniref:pentatricopeptide repeat-containing protein At3g29230 n=1 Tax=Rutidosis leptorrhynchoides TaxID=125765 RepID=UPI003A9A06C4
MQIPAPVRAPAWVSTRRLLEQKLSDLHKCTDFKQLNQIHALVYKSNLHQDPFVIPKLITAFSLCRQLPSAVKAFNQVNEPNVHLYNTMIRAHVHNSQPAQAFETFLLMQNSGVFPDNFTYPFLLKACGGQNDYNLVKMIHSCIEKFGFSSDVYVPNALIDSYSRCGVIGVGAAKKVFSVMEDKDIVSWNTMIGGLLKANRLSDARQLFDEMPERDMVSWNTILDGYAKAGALNDAFELFEKMPERNVVSWSTMLTGYSKAGDMDMTRMLFDKMPVKNMVSWTIIIAGYAGKGLAKEAVDLYERMEEAGYRPDDGAIISILAACAESGLLWLGRRVHQSIKRNKFQCSTLVENALVDMYAKCGNLNKALSIFNAMRVKDLVSWNAMIHGLAMHGDGDEALKLFSRMKKDGFTPDKVTFVGVLCACTHAGFIDEGIQYFYTMERDYGVAPEIEHYGCVIDLLGRGGRLQEAFRLVRTMPVEPNVIIWGALLGACRLYNAVELAQDVLEHLVKLEPQNAGNYSMLSNIYAATGNWAGVADVRLKMKNTGNDKPSGASLIELEDGVHEFTVKNTAHPANDKIYQMVDGLSDHIKKVGCFPDVIC